MYVLKFTALAGTAVPTAIAAAPTAAIAHFKVLFILLYLLKTSFPENHWIAANIFISSDSSDRGTSETALLLNMLINGGNAQISLFSDNS